MSRRLDEFIVSFVGMRDELRGFFTIQALMKFVELVLLGAILIALLK